MESQIKRLALEQGMKNVQQFALKAGLPWSMAKAIWTGSIENRALKTLVKASTALGCKLEDLFKIS
jgi:DNA-binding Xre family transcriptional regulator